MRYHLSGLVAATLTPLHADGAVNLEPIPRIVDLLERAGVSGIYICGSTGEGISLTREERQAVATAYVGAAKGRLQTVVQVGHNSLQEAQSLAAHAAGIGADAISATAPSYFKIGTVPMLVDCMAEIAAGAPETPFYYYHIPSLTGAALDMVEFLPAAEAKIANLVGMKYTTPQAFEYQACLNLEGGRFDVLWGCDEMFLSALATGARGAIGSTYNVAAPLYGKILAAFEAGDMAEAQRLQLLSVRMIRVMLSHPFLALLKWLLGLYGIECGGCRLPQANLSADQAAGARAQLDEMGFFDWCGMELQESP
ncbi:MAG: dihydrodipicolinate synthase family protein [Thermoguttaceae bacterium]